MRAMLWIAVSGFLLGSGSAYANDASPTRPDEAARRGYDDVSYGDIPQATFGAAAAPAIEVAANGHDDVAYGAAPGVWRGRGALSDDALTDFRSRKIAFIVG